MCGFGKELVVEDKLYSPSSQKKTEKNPIVRMLNPNLKTSAKAPSSPASKAEGLL